MDNLFKKSSLQKKDAYLREYNDLKNSVGSDWPNM